MAELERIYMSGFLRKRQRGKHVKRESQRKNLKFQWRYCTLTEHTFTYSKKENSKARGSFPAERIKVVINIDPKIFKSTLPSPDLCFQVGDENEVLYLIAATKTDGEKWKDAFLKVATKRGNTMLDHYHWGAYGSKATGQWSCCNESRKDAPGCQSTAAISARMNSNVSRTSTKSDDTLKSDDSSPSSIRQSSSCNSGFSNQYSSMEPDCLSPKSHWEPVNFDDRATNVRRPRAGTNESGIDVNQYKKSEAKRQQLSSVGSSEVDSDTMSSLGTLSDEGTEDEGIVQNISKHPGTQVEGKKETLCIDQGVSTVNYNMFIPAYSLNLPQPSSTLLLHQNLLTIGMNGMLQVWNAATTDLTLETSLKIAGQAVSLDSWNDFIAVGSSVVQVIELKAGTEPKRILYAKGKDRLQSSDSQFFVTFLGEDGHLASAKFGGRVIDIWAPPSADAQVVTKPESSITIDDGTILSLTASKHPTHTSVTVLTDTDGCLKLNTLDWKASILLFSPETAFEMNEGQEISNYSPHIMNINGMYIASGNKKVVSLIDKNIRQIAHSISLDEDVTCISYAKGVIMVGTTGGKVMVLSSDNLTKLGQLENEQTVASVVAMAIETDCRCVYVAHENGVIKVWNAHLSTQCENGQLCNAHECLLGMQLCSEGILTQRQIIPINNNNDLSLSFPDVDVHLQLPEEVLDLQNPAIEVAFAPLGPGVGSQFVLPDGMIPVSPAVWLCFFPQTKFNNPAILKLPHCFECKHHDDTKYLQFLKAEHNDITQDRSGQSIVTFRPVDGASSKFFHGTHYGTLEDKHFCMYCLAKYNSEKDVIGKIHYCLTILKPITYPKDENTRIYCILHLDLEGCKKLVKEQTPDGYITEEKLLQFDIKAKRYDSALVIELDRDRAEACRWMITLQSENKIYAEDVNFFNYRNMSCLTDVCTASSLQNHYPYVYPPRFTLEVSSKHALHPSVLKLSFVGAKRELSTEIQLDWPMSEQDLQLRDREQDRGNNGYWPSRKDPIHFTSHSY